MELVEASPLSHLPIIDISPLFGNDTGSRADVAKRIGKACRDTGFFYIVGHGIDPKITSDLYKLSKEFFSLSTEEKMKIEMDRPPYLGYLPIGAERTSGRPDVIEGLGFGIEAPPTDPRVLAGYPIHGTHKFPDRPHGFRGAVTSYMEACGAVGQAVMQGIALSLGLDSDYFRRLYTADPLLQFYINHCPSTAEAEKVLGEIKSWEDDAYLSLGEHTDYGMLTLLWQDNLGGLEVKALSGEWIKAAPVCDALICNIGDMLDRLTGGHYRSTVHRVRRPKNTTGRLSFPLFFDPNALSVIRPLPEKCFTGWEQDKDSRWDHENIHEFEGTFGNYLSKVFKRSY